MLFSGRGELLSLSDFRCQATSLPFTFPGIGHVTKSLTRASRAWTERLKESLFSVLSSFFLFFYSQPGLGIWWDSVIIASGSFGLLVHDLLKVLLVVIISWPNMKSVLFSPHTHTLQIFQIKMKCCIWWYAANLETEKQRSLCIIGWLQSTPVWESMISLTLTNMT